MELNYLGNNGLSHLCSKIKAMLTSKADKSTSIQYMNNAVSVNGNALSPENMGCAPSNYLDIVYPVGSVYMSINAVQPSELFGGTWEEVRMWIAEEGNDSYYMWKRIA